VSVFCLVKQFHNMAHYQMLNDNDNNVNECVNVFNGRITYVK